MRKKEIQRRLDIFLSIRQCLIGEISKNLRLASATWDASSACVYFYFDGKISDRDRDALEDVHTCFISHFSAEDLSASHFEYIQVDEPNSIHYEGECFFARKERYNS